jgi:glutamine amidotransferase
MDWSEEGDTACLGILAGEVKRLSRGLKVPHMGWNSVHLADASHPVFQGIPQESYFYFVHSYFAAPADPQMVVGTTQYGVEFCSVAARGNLVATQFHPEKSGPLGLRLYDNFVRRLVYREPASVV